jgi:zeta-carotene desaturase
MADFDSIIIGGGLSGLSAAVELALNNRKVLLLEQHPSCGGRAISYRDSVMHCNVDNGQHLLMGCYHSTRRYLRLIGSENLVSLQPSLSIQYIHKNQTRAVFQCPDIPPPLHLLFGILQFSPIPWRDRLKTLRIAFAILHATEQKEQSLETKTVDEWLIALGQSSLTRQYLWDIITIGALNNHPKNVSALMLFRILRAAFLGERENASLLIPKADLTELFISPAIRFIKARGGEVKKNCRVSKIFFKRDKAISVQTNEKKKLSASSFICSVPWYEAGKLIPDVFQHRDGTLFRSSPIISFHIWFDRQVTDLEFAALIDTRIQWFFNKSMSEQINKSLSNKNTTQYLTLVMSDSEEFIEKDKQELLRIAIEDLSNVLPDVKQAKVVHSKIIKEKRATFSPVTGLEEVRPHCQTLYQNLFLAGDWTSTGYPATIESAIMSGQRAAKSVLEQQTWTTETF